MAEPTAKRRRVQAQPVASVPNPHDVGTYTAPLMSAAECEAVTVPLAEAEERLRQTLDAHGVARVAIVSGAAAPAAPAPAATAQPANL